MVLLTAMLVRGDAGGSGLITIVMMTMMMITTLVVVMTMIWWWHHTIYIMAHSKKKQSFDHYFKEHPFSFTALLSRKWDQKKTMLFWHLTNLMLNIKASSTRLSQDTKLEPWFPEVVMITPAWCCQRWSFFVFFLCNSHFLGDISYTFSYTVNPSWNKVYCMYVCITPVQDL